MGCGGGNAKFLPKPRPADPDDDAPVSTTAATSPQPKTNAALDSTPNSAADHSTANVNANSLPGIGNPLTSVVPAGSATDGAPAFALADPAALTLEIEGPANGQAVSIEEGHRLSILRMRKIAAALGAFARDKGRFPPFCTFDNESNSALSWRVQILPYLGHQELYGKFRMSESFDSPHNSKLLASIPPVFQAPMRQDTKTNYLAVVGTGTLFIPGDRQGQPPAAIADGPSNTAMLLEVDDAMAVEWTCPRDYVPTTGNPWRGLSELRAEGFLVGWADGSVSCWPRSASEALIPGLFTIAGKEPPARHASVAAVAAIGVSNNKATRGIDSGASADFPPTPRPMTGGAVASTTTPKTAVADQPTSLSVRTSPKSGMSETANQTPADIRREPPSEEQLEQASTIVRDLYSQEFKNAKLDKDKRDFAKKLIEDVERIEADSAGRFVLLRAARDVAAKAGDVTVAIEACDRLGREFRVDLLSMKLKVLEQAVVNLAAESELAPLYDNSLKLGDEALELDDFKAAQSLYRLAMNAARRGRSVEREYFVNLRENNLRETRVAYQRITDHVHTLVRAPEDPAANAAVGRYYLLLKRDWDRGLPMAARGDNALLRKLAESDLAQPTDGEAMVAVGDQWWDFAEKLSVETERTSGRIRARHWYEAAQPMLGASLQKIRVEKRIAEIKREQDKAEGKLPAAPGRRS